ncbi:MAG: efflux RND transporter periplasmic adaptor subunit [Brachymonas sp.]|nr:efflux RND transporter periplasmic adaptor subunit [Brachymonas sp.]
MWKTLLSRRWWLLLAAVLLVLLGWGAYRMFFASEPAAPLITAAVERGDIEDAVLATGTIQASKLINVGAQVSGQVKKLYVKLGDTVKAGQQIADVDAITQENALQDAQAALTSARAQKTAREASLAQAQQNFERQKYMFERDATSRQDYQNAQQALAAARADLTNSSTTITQAEVRVKTARTNLGYARITAPMDGTIVSIVTDEGQTMNAVQSAPTVVKLAQLDTMTIQSLISEADVPRIKPGMSAYFTILGQPERQHEATLRTVEPGPSNMTSYDPNAATANSSNAVYYNGLLDAPNPNGTLRIGMTAQVSIVLDSAKDALLIPAGALGRPEGGRRGRGGGAGNASSAAAQASAPANGALTPASGASAPGPRRGDGKPGRLYTVRVATGEPGKEVIEERQVRIGLNNRVHAVVLEGLQEGEKVVVGDATGPTNSRMSGRARVRL